MEGTRPHAQQGMPTAAAVQQAEASAPSVALPLAASCHGHAMPAADLSSVAPMACQCSHGMRIAAAPSPTLAGAQYLESGRCVGEAKTNVRRAARVRARCRHCTTAAFASKQGILLLLHRHRWQEEGVGVSWRAGRRLFRVNLSSAVMPRSPARVLQVDAKRGGGRCTVTRNGNRRCSRKHKMSGGHCRWHVVPHGHQRQTSRRVHTLDCCRHAIASATPCAAKQAAPSHSSPCLITLPTALKSLRPTTACTGPCQVARRAAPGLLRTAGGALAAGARDMCDWCWRGPLPQAVPRP